MAERRSGGHPSIEDLIAYREGSLGYIRGDEIRRHVDSCEICRLELGMLGRFERIDGDEDLLREAQWPAAQTKLEQAYHDTVSRRLPSGRRSRRRIAALRWLVPLAAAAAVVAVVAALEWLPQLQRSSDSRGRVTMRGDVEAPSLTLQSPLGELDSIPRVFLWSASEEYEQYRLEVFRNDLAPVFTIEEVPATRYEVPDSLASLFEPGGAYLWKVTARRGVEPPKRSLNGWFTVR